jgi:hypothetical protein
VSDDIPFFDGQWLVTSDAIYDLIVDSPSANHSHSCLLPMGLSDQTTAQIKKMGVTLNGCSFQIQAIGQPHQYKQASFVVS